MTDLELLEKCADASGLATQMRSGQLEFRKGDNWGRYNPFKLSGQLVFLLKQFRVSVLYSEESDQWEATARWRLFKGRRTLVGKPMKNSDLNRAVIASVASLLEDK